MISQTAEYALRAMLCLAGNPGARLTTPQIAEAAQVPAGYLSKVLQELGKAGLVRSQRGLGGGFLLSRPAAEITILQIINAVDPVQRIHACPLNLPEHADCLCPLHRRLDEAMAMVEHAFSRSSLADLVAGADEDTGCAFPPSIEADR